MYEVTEKILREVRKVIVGKDDVVEFRSSILYLRLMYQNIQVRLQVIISRTVTHRERQVYQLQRSGVIMITRTAREHLA